MFKDCNSLRAICAHPYMLRRKEIGDENSSFDDSDIEDTAQSQAPQSQRSDSVSNGK